MKLKRCSKCGVDKSVNEFYISQGNSWGKCKECVRAEQRIRSKGYRHPKSDAPYEKVNMLEDYLRTMRELE